MPLYWSIRYSQYIYAVFILIICLLVAALNVECGSDGGATSADAEIVSKRKVRDKKLQESERARTFRYESEGALKKLLLDSTPDEPLEKHSYSRYAVANRFKDQCLHQFSIRELTEGERTSIKNGRIQVIAIDGGHKLQFRMIGYGLENLPEGKVKAAWKNFVTFFSQVYTPYIHIANIREKCIYDAYDPAAAFSLDEHNGSIKSVVVQLTPVPTVMLTPSETQIPKYAREQLYDLPRSSNFQNLGGCFFALKLPLSTPGGPLIMYGSKREVTAEIVAGKTITIPYSLPCDCEPENLEQIYFWFAERGNRNTVVIYIAPEKVDDGRPILLPEPYIGYVEPLRTTTTTTTEPLTLPPKAFFQQKQISRNSDVFISVVTTYGRCFVDEVKHVHPLVLVSSRKSAAMSRTLKNQSVEANSGGMASAKSEHEK